MVGALRIATKILSIFLKSAFEIQNFFKIAPEYCSKKQPQAIHEKTPAHS
jgi:hypothetical protein